MFERMIHFPPELIERAKAEGKAVVAIAYDDRHLGDKYGSSDEYFGLADQQTVAEARAALFRAAVRARREKGWRRRKRRARTSGGE